MRKKRQQKSPYFVHTDGQLYHFIIMKDDESAIWKRTYHSKEEAQAELSLSNLSGYHIEQRFSQFQPSDVDSYLEEISGDQELANW